MSVVWAPGFDPQYPASTDTMALHTFPGLLYTSFVKEIFVGLGHELALHAVSHSTQ